MTIIDNVSEKVMYNRLQELDKYKDILLATVTHDLKTPLNCMINYLKNAFKSENI